MFEWLRRQSQKVHQARMEVASEAAFDTQRLMASVEGALGGIPPQMAEDPFVIGVLSSHAAIASKIISNGQAPLAVCEAAMIQAVQAVFGLERTKAIDLLFRFKNHAEHTKGAQVATLLLAARYGRRDLQGDPLIVEARERLRLMPAAFRSSFGATEDAQASVMLCQDLLVKPLKEKYAEVWRRT
jgi:hypothetical protein